MLMLLAVLLLLYILLLWLLSYLFAALSVVGSAVGNGTVHKYIHKLTGVLSLTIVRSVGTQWLPAKDWLVNIYILRSVGCRFVVQVLPLSPVWCKLIG